MAARAENGKNGPEPVLVTNLPAVQQVAGSVSVAGTVNVGNLPAPNAAPFGLVNQLTVIPAVNAGGISSGFSGTSAHDVQVWVNVQAVIAHGQVPLAEIFFVANGNPVFYFIPLTLVRADVTSGEDFYVGSSTFPIFIPRNTNYTLSLTRDVTFTGNLQGAFITSGVNLN